MKLFGPFLLMLFFLAACSTAPLVQEEDILQVLEDFPSENTVILDPIGYTYALSGEMPCSDSGVCAPWKRSFTGERLLEGYTYIVNLHDVISIKFFSKEKMLIPEISIPRLECHKSRDDLADSKGNCRYFFSLKNSIIKEQFDVYCEYHPYLLEWKKNDPNNKIYPGTGIMDYSMYYNTYHYKYINHLPYSIWHERNPHTLVSKGYLVNLFPSSPQDMTPVADNCMIEIGDRERMKDLPFAIGEGKDTVLARIVEHSDTSYCEDLKKEHGTVHFGTPHFGTKDLALFNHQVFCFVSVQDPVIEEITLL